MGIQTGQRIANFSEMRKDTLKQILSMTGLLLSRFRRKSEKENMISKCKGDVQVIFQICPLIGMKFEGEIDSIQY